MSEPIVGAGLFRTVMGAAGGRCQCEGACGQPHKSGGRCPREHDQHAGKHSGPIRLLAAPADPLTTDRAAAALPAGQLRAWCPTCLGAARRAAQRTARTKPVPGQDGLFDI
ncbi:hypothetical protein [Streptomyces albireticuli]|uniref:Uncharacterized protein n=1 Tax=Streptomyces albireticuli TaxID=1940 RepID=A0A2A2D7M3_9ACTN|nr:hypothetical protein [Streptomyces albireticuli]MCD9144361.1 hypothetical protein [Streptomyces albireticuli]MCD9161996.1 hypothetical protein [Streptomyces albireticuli]MCD9193998.1 hypothetical protein [Streptomyces albireticuli]PAU47514.1 hypothetical protein CK936_18130 [Streptomyces albireticuli]